MLDKIQQVSTGSSNDALYHIVSVMRRFNVFTPGEEYLTNPYLAGEIQRNGIIIDSSVSAPVWLMRKWGRWVAPIVVMNAIETVVLSAGDYCPECENAGLMDRKICEFCKREYDDNTNERNQ